VIVADVNLLMYFFVEGELTATAEAVYARTSVWMAPVLWRSEMLNVLNGYVRRGTLSLEGAVDIFQSAEEIVIIPVEEQRPEDVLRLSTTSRCTAYDCEYVALAQQLRIPLVTADGAVLRAFPETAVSPQAYVA
jgi:predicted nucleic acid-binding protein